MKTSILVVQRINNQIYNDQISVLVNFFSCVFSLPHLQLSDTKQKYFKSVVYKQAIKPI